MALPMGNKHSAIEPSRLKINENETTFESQKIADHFNKFFCSMGQNLANTLNQAQNDSKPYADYLTNRISSSIFLDIPVILKSATQFIRLA